MKESVGYTVTLNIVIVFITIIVAFLCAALIYFKSNKFSNVITSAIEKYEEFNDFAVNDINKNLNAVGYGSHSINCAPSIDDVMATFTTGGTKENSELSCPLTANVSGQGIHGYCVYECYETNEDGEFDYYYYKIRTNMMIGIPIINDILDFPIYSNTNRLYNFDNKVIE